MFFLFLFFSFGRLGEYFRKLFVYVPELKGFRVGGDILCLHGVSAGEVASFFSFALLAREHYRLLITTSTFSGIEMAKKLYGGDLIVYFPYDCPFSVFRFLFFFKPRAICFAEGEFWPFMLAYAHMRRIPTFLINGRLSDRDISRYRLLGSVFRRVFSYHRLLFLQSVADYDRVCSLGIDRSKLHLAGNLKFDLEYEGIELGSIFGRARLVIVLGSSHFGEEDLVLDVFSRLYELFPDILLILAPRDTARALELSELVSSYSFKSVMFSELKFSCGEFSLADSDVVVVDTMGDLLSLYKSSDIALLGGSFVSGFGGHNPIEPAYFGKPVVIGPFYYNIASIVQAFVLAGGILLCCDRVSGKRLRDCLRGDLFVKVRRLIEDVSFRQKVGKNARFVVDMSRGGSRRTFDMIRRNI